MTLATNFADLAIYSRQKKRNMYLSDVNYWMRPGAYDPSKRYEAQCLSLQVKFIYSEKATKFLRNLNLFLTGKVEIFLEQREVTFLSPSKICKSLNFSTVHL